MAPAFDSSRWWTGGGRRAVVRPGHPLEQAAERSATRAVGEAGGREPRESGAAVQAARSLSGAARAPRVVDEALGSPGQPLERSTRREFESRFGRDFSHVRVHHDELAACSARAIGAQAYSSGSHVVFGRGRFQPGTSSGRRLLAHELAHTAQQDGSPGAATVWRKPVDLNDFDSGSFSDATLLGYLNKLRKARKIEDNLDSDDKARGIVRRWLSGADEFALDPEIKVLLVKEMQSGFTGNDDERAILNLLEKSARPDAEAMFGPSGLDPDDLDSDFHGDEEDALRSFYDRLFIGGRKAAMKGGAVFSAAPDKRLEAPYNPAALRAVVEERMSRLELRLRDKPLEYRKYWAAKFARAEAADLEPQLAGLPAGQRDAAAKDMVADRILANSRAETLDKEIAKAPTPLQKQLLTRRQARLNGEALFLDLLMQRAFREIALASPAKEEEFQKQTKALDPDEAKAAREAIKPKTEAAVAAEVKAADEPAGADKAAVAPLPPPPAFKEKLPGEKETYGDKVKARIPKIIDDKHARMAAKKTEKEHSDPKLTRSLDDLQLIADLAKDEVDLVLGQFYDKTDKKKFPSFQADKRDKSGALLQKGNLHDVWQDEEDRLKADPAGYKKVSAKFWLFYLIQNDHLQEGVANTVEAINRAHDATPSFDKKSEGLNDEAKIIRKVGDPFVDSEQTRLYEIGRGWPGLHREGEIFVQLFKDPDPKEDRRLLWGMLATLVHEYLHKLANKKYKDYAQDLGGEHSTEGSTLIEGVDSFFSEIVWGSTVKRARLPALRNVVEPDAVAAGLPFDANLLPDAPNRAPTYDKVVRLVSVVGIRNLYAAYFQGKVELIGGAVP